MCLVLSLFFPHLHRHLSKPCWSNVLGVARWRLASLRLDAQRDFVPIGCNRTSQKSYQREVSNRPPKAITYAYIPHFS